ncbi:selenoneine biosynthesis selenosugar synthase SenB [Azohydromonas caseinilytica]|uniref:TIGR04348 family glycosyltransferase n=1 Tax=Azohydromonas caseinilytica TaxID=2728836 RepID=A0A848F9U2_9BURK|nr:selenoneine biosynthesis selenosugar synthase SenB [Azohydromonas caseinilytica]NML15515.1 TIGR04348 family glycosyltransferase [Azohydromonas caseinilytica]
MSSTPGSRPRICLVTPALAAANNGNWHTASRWARLLDGPFEVLLTDRWRGEAADVLLALHARRSAESIAAWAQAQPHKPIALALTGTDLYRDIHHDADAQRSLALARRLVVLQERAVDDVPAPWRDKAVVCFPSVEPGPAVACPPTPPLQIVMVGHLRAEKDPATAWAALRRLAGRGDWRFQHVGGALDEALGTQARALQVELPAYEWLDALPHAETRERIARAHVLVNASVVEGAPTVVVEAVASGTPVLASRIPGHVGLLGADYPGLFGPGAAAALATLIERCLDEPAMLPALSAAAALRAPLFEPARERHTLRALMADLLEMPCP